MGHKISLKDFGMPVVHPEAVISAFGESMPRRCLVDDLHDAEPQSQVDRLIADLMDIIVRASAVTGSSLTSGATSADAVAEVVALTMMQGLLERDIRSTN